MVILKACQAKNRRLQSQDPNDPIFESQECH